MKSLSADESGMASFTASCLIFSRKTSMTYLITGGARLLAITIIEAVTKL